MQISSRGCLNLSRPHAPHAMQSREVQRRINYRWPPSDATSAALSSRRTWATRHKARCAQLNRPHRTSHAKTLNMSGHAPKTTSCLRATSRSISLIRRPRVVLARARMVPALYPAACVEGMVMCLRRPAKASKGTRSARLLLGSCQCQWQRASIAV